MRTNIAFHRTTAENAPKILAEGLKCFASRGLTLPDSNAPNFWESFDALKSAGFKFTGQLDMTREVMKMVPAEECARLVRTASWDARSRTESVFVRRGGVHTTWAKDGETIAIDLDKVAEMGVNWTSDNFGSDGDLQVFGDIPATAVLGIVCDEWMQAHGFTVSVDGWGF